MTGLLLLLRVAAIHHHHHRRRHRRRHHPHHPHHPHHHTHTTTYICLLPHGDSIKYVLWFIWFIAAGGRERVRKRFGRDVMSFDSLVFGIERVEALLY